MVARKQQNVLGDHSKACSSDGFYRADATSPRLHEQSVKLDRKDLGGAAAWLLISSRRRRRCQFCHANCLRGVHDLGSSCHQGGKGGSRVLGLGAIRLPAAE